MIYNIDYVRNKPLVTLSDGKRGNKAGSDVPSEDQARDIYIYIYIYIYINHNICLRFLLSANQ